MAAAYRRQTDGLHAALQQIGLALGGKPGARLATTLHMPTSWMTVLRRVRTVAPPMNQTPRLPALRLTLDAWHIRLFGQDAEDPEHDARHRLIEALLWNVASRALELGTHVILDYGLWAREEREDYRARATQLGARSEVHYLDVPEDELVRRLVRRNAHPSPMDFYIPEAMMQPWMTFFQQPTRDELERSD